MAEMLATDDRRDQSQAAPEAASRLYGVIDVLRSNRIAGWAIDRSDPQAALDIEILRDGRPVATVRAERPRRDLETRGLGTGRYGFSAAIEPPVEPGFEFMIEAVARAPDGERTELKRAGAAAAGEDPARRLLEGVYLRLGAVERAAGTGPAGEAERIRDLLARIEVCQGRLERRLDEVAPLPGASGRGLLALVALSLALGSGSLGLGLLSLWHP
jgi:hypothetical protein